jgi:signal transduction histidine kinase
VIRYNRVVFPIALWPPVRTKRRALLVGVMLIVLPLAAAAQDLPAPPPAPQPADANPGDEPAEPDVSWPDPEQPQVLTTAGDVRSLSPRQAAAGLPVRMSGVVTHVSGMPPFMFVRDITGSVCVTMPRDREVRAQLRLGTVIQVQGVTADGGLVPYVTGVGKDPPRVEVLGTAPLPRPRSVAVAQLRTPAHHGEFVEVEGVVRSVHTETVVPTWPAATVLALSDGQGRVEAVIFGRAGEAVVTEQFLGAVVKARGVFNAAAPDRQEWPAMRLLLRSTRDIVVRQAPTPSRDLPVAGIDTLSAPPPGTQPAAPSSGRARVQGVVTLAVPRRGMFVQDATGGVWVEPPPADAAEKSGAGRVRPGDRVDATGFPTRRAWSDVLADAVWEVTGRSPLPDAPLVTSEAALDPTMNGRLVRIEGLVLSASHLSDQTTIVLQSGSRVFLARLADLATQLPPEARTGTWVRLTGVCVQSGLTEGLDAGGAAPAAAGERSAAPSFHLLLAGPRAVEPIGAPGWWTPGRVLAAVGALAAVAVVSFAWVFALRRRVARQTALIREHVAKRTLYEERVRIARDLHDSLEQDLLGITLQLNATDKLLAQPEQARRSLQLAAAMVRRSQAETHRAVWDLRERRPGQDGLVATLREAIAGLAPPRTGAGTDDAGRDLVPRVEVRVHGEQRELPAQVQNHLLRVAVEAVTNAVKHAGATRIEIDLRFDEGRVELRVRDDGRGFDADRLPPPSSGHFGLFGMRERAEKLNGHLVIRSRPGEGTEIALGVPTEPEGSGAAPAHNGAPVGAGA